MGKCQPGFESGVAHGSQSHGNSARNTTQSRAPWTSKVGDAHQARDACVQDYTQSFAMVKCFIFMLEKLCSAC